VLYGAPGTGLSTCMAFVTQHLTLTLAAQGDEWWSAAGTARGHAVVYRFLGRTPSASSAHLLLRSLCQQLGEIFGNGEPALELPGSVDGLAAEFQRLIGLASPQLSLFLFLDGIDELLDDDPCADLSWLPVSLPKYVRIVVSATSGGIVGDCDGNDGEDHGSSGGLGLLRALGLPPTCFLEVPPLRESEGTSLLQHWLASSRRLLTEEQEWVVLEGFSSTPTPAYLTAALCTSSLWTSSDTGMDLAPDLNGVIADLLERLEVDLGSLFVRRALGYLCAASNGLTDLELLDVLSCDDDVLNVVLEGVEVGPVRRFPPALWFRLKKALGLLLAPVPSVHGTRAPHVFPHRQVHKAVRSHCLPDAQAEILAHTALVDYFDSTWVAGKPCLTPGGTWVVVARGVHPQHLWGGSCPNSRKLQELPVHLKATGQFDRLESRVCEGRALFQVPSVRALNLGCMYDLDRATSVVQGHGGHMLSINQDLCSDPSEDDPSGVAWAGKLSAFRLGAGRKMLDELEEILKADAELNGGVTTPAQGVSALVTEVNAVAVLLVTEGCPDAGADMLSRLVSVTDGLMGPHSLGASVCRNNLGRAELANGRGGEARVLLQRALRDMKVAIRQSMPTARCGCNLALVLQADGEHKEARALVDAALEIYQAHLGRDTAAIARLLSWSAELLVAEGSFKVAAPLLERSCHIWTEVVPTDQCQLRLVQRALASVSLLSGNNLQAVDLLRDALSSAQNQHGPHHTEVALACSHLATALSELGAHYEALPLLQRAVDLLTEALGPVHPWLSDAQAALIDSTHRLESHEAANVLVKTFNAQTRDTQQTLLAIRDEQHAPLQMGEDSSAAVKPTLESALLRLMRQREYLTIKDVHSALSFIVGEMSSLPAIQPRPQQARVPPSNNTSPARPSPRGPTRLCEELGVSPRPRLTPRKPNSPPRSRPKDGLAAYATATKFIGEPTASPPIKGRPLHDFKLTPRADKDELLNALFPWTAVRFSKERWFPDNMHPTHPPRFFSTLDYTPLPMVNEPTRSPFTGLPAPIGTELSPRPPAHPLTDDPGLGAARQPFHRRMTHKPAAPRSKGSCRGRTRPSSRELASSSHSPRSSSSENVWMRRKSVYQPPMDKELLRWDLRARQEEALKTMLRTMAPTRPRTQQHRSGANTASSSLPPVRASVSAGNPRAPAHTRGGPVSGGADHAQNAADSRQMSPSGNATAWYGGV